MAVLFDYLDWRGDLGFLADGANEMVWVTSIAYFVKAAIS